MDFDDLLTKRRHAVCEARRHPRALPRTFRHILVDEYQDTNNAQNQMVLMLAGGHRAVAVVGDSDQARLSDGAWADFRNILQFEEAFPDVTTVVLDQNYRSTQTILDAANAVIENNTERRPKSLWTDLGDGRRIQRYHAEDEGDEANLHRLKRSPRERVGGNFRDIAVLYRTNAQSRVIEEAFMRHGVPYKVVGGTRFYDRREVKDAMAYLRAVVNPADEVS